MPCKELALHLDRLVEQNPDVILRKVDIVNWESAATQQADREFGIKTIPHVRIFGKKGDLIADVTGVDVAAIEDAIRKGSN